MWRKIKTLCTNSKFFFMNALNYFKEHSLRFILLILCFSITIILITNFEIENPIEISEQQVLAFGITLQNWGYWLAIVGIPFTAFWAMFQYDKGISIRKHEKAVEIAKEFSSNIVAKCSIVNSVYLSSTLNQLFQFDKKKYQSFKNFNVHELREIYDDDFPTQVRELLDSEKMRLELNELYHNYLEQCSPLTFNGNSTSKKTTSNIRDIFAFHDFSLPYHFEELVSDLLNDLEYICMSISSNAADSKYIYQSLHLMFLRTIRILAIQISLDNINYSDKLFTNIIHVYNEWTSRYINDYTREKKRKEKIEHILNPKIKTV